VKIKGSGTRWGTIARCQGSLIYSILSIGYLRVGNWIVIAQHIQGKSQLQSHQCLCVAAIANVKMAKALLHVK